MNPCLQTSAAGEILLTDSCQIFNDRNHSGSLDPKNQIYYIQKYGIVSVHPTFAKPHISNKYKDNHDVWLFLKIAFTLYNHFTYLDILFTPKGI